MKGKIEKLGKVSITVEKDYWDKNKAYNRLTIVERQGTSTAYLSRKAVPIGIDITDRNYWITISKWADIPYEIVQEFGDSPELVISQKVVTLKVNELQGLINSINDIIGEGGSIDERIAVETNRAQVAEELLREAYESLSQSQAIPKTAEEWASMTSWEEGVIYRVAGTTSYTDYMYNGITTVPMATYNNAIDDEPTAGSNNLVKSGGVFEEISKEIKPAIGLFYLEQGGIDTSGVETSRNDRVRTSKIETNTYIKVNTGYQIFYKYLYLTDGTFVISESVGLDEITLKPENGYYRLVFAKTDSSQNISVNEDIIHSSRGNLMDEVEFIDERLEFVEQVIDSTTYTTEDMLFEDGCYINANGGKQSTISGYWGIYTKEIDSGGVITCRLGSNGSFTASVAVYSSHDISADSLISNILLTFGVHEYRMLVPKTAKLVAVSNRTATLANPSIVLKLDDTRIDAMKKSLYGDNNIQLAQGGIDTSGVETSRNDRVRTSIIEIDKVLSIKVNSGYVVYYAYYYNKETDAFVSSESVNSSAFVYNGAYNLRLAFAKSDLSSEIHPDDNIIAELSTQLIAEVEMLENQSVTERIVDTIVTIPEPNSARLLFFRKGSIGGLWSDGNIWRYIVDNNLFIWGKSYKTIQISNGDAVTGYDTETVRNLYSVTKLMTAVITCDNISSDNLAESVTIQAGDMIDSTTDHYVQTGDVVTIDDLLCAALVVSDSNASQALARVIGYKINPSAVSDDAARTAFYDAMNAKATALGLTHTTFTTMAWTGGRSTPTEQCVFLRYIYNNYPIITSRWGLLSYTMVVTGANARTYVITSTTDSTARAIIPEFVGGKTGTGEWLGNLAFVWKSGDDYYATMLFQSDEHISNSRFKDSRRIIDEAYEYI